MLQVIFFTEHLVNPIESTSAKLYWEGLTPYQLAAKSRVRLTLTVKLNSTASQPRYCTRGLQYLVMTLNWFE